MHDVSLAFVWHQHQPYYPDDVGGENPMPWVRLHASKDYWGMAMHLKEVPEVHATINLVPSLLVQLLGYAERDQQDDHLRVSRLPADDLNSGDLAYLLDNFFMVHPDHMIKPFPRYYELYQQRGLSVDSAERAAKRFSKRDVLDLQCWSNLVWIHPIAFELDSDLAAFRAKGQNWTEADKQWLLEKQMQLVREVIPLHKELADRGQIELTTTPFYHPILPLLIDKRLARQAMPHVRLPEYLDGYPEDASEHLKRGVAFHEKVFGTRPRGMWPSEGSVAQEVVPLIADAGIQWIATDEEILTCSTNGWVSRDAQGHARNPELLYRPWRVEERGKQLQMVFRDHAMSDQIGFHYQRYSAQHAADDFINKIEAIGRATTANAGHRSTLATIVLDGENCWEYYYNGGVDFLRELYHRVAKHPKIKAVKVSEYLDKHPATDKIGHLFAGSWIQHNFGIWIGHPECNRAWDLLFETREYLKQAQKSGEKTQQQLESAWEELYIAEGSDWFWWFGDSHTSAQDDLFDRLFRKHLQNVYTLLGDSVPPELLQPISASGRRAALLHSQPASLLNVKVDGRQTYFEWLNAGHHACESSRGAMSMTTQTRVQDVYFGFDEEHLYLRIDAREGAVSQRLADVDSLRMTFTNPEGFELLVPHPSDGRPLPRLFHHDVPVSESGAKAAAASILEVSIPWRNLGVSPQSALQFYIDLIRDKQTIERIPNEGMITTTVPTPEFELMMWQA